VREWTEPGHGGRWHANKDVASSGFERRGGREGRNPRRAIESLCVREETLHIFKPRNIQLLKPVLRGQKDHREAPTPSCCVVGQRLEARPGSGGPPLQLNENVLVTARQKKVGPDIAKSRLDGIAGSAVLALEVVDNAALGFSGSSVMAIVPASVPS
jgi:hypothetical protein